MSGPSSFRLSQETRDLLGQNKGFFESILGLYNPKDPEKTPLALRSKDAESRTEAKTLANGDVEVSIVLPLDSNAEASDGRIYLRDTFVFDPSEKILKSFNRSVEYNGKGDASWQGWLDKYQAIVAANPMGVTDKRVQRFAAITAQSYGRSITDEKHNTLPEIKEVWKKDHRYIDAVNQLVGEQKAGLKLKIKDKLNFYNLVRRGNKLEVTFRLAIDEDDDPANGRILLRDKFTLDAKSLEFQGLERSWELAPEAESNPEYQRILASLVKKEDPTSEQAEAFIKALAPVLLPKGEPNYTALLPLLSDGHALPKDYQSPISRRKNSNAEDRKAGSDLALEVMYQVAQEQLTKRFDESQGWLHFGAKVDPDQGQKILASLFEKIKAASEKNSTQSPFALLQGLELTEAEAQARTALLGDRILTELNDLGQESDAQLRTQGLLVFARERLFKQEQLANSAVFIAQQLEKSEAGKKGASELLAIAEGKGNLGQKMDYILPRFAQEVSKPSMLAGMAAAPFLGTAFEMGGLKLAQWGYRGRQVGKAAKILAVVGGMGGEAIAFTTIHKGIDSATENPDKVWKGTGNEILSTMLLFGGMRLVHGGGAWATSRLAEGKANVKWLPDFGYRFGAGEFAGSATRLPTGRMVFGEFAPAAGAGIPTLTTSGKILSGTMNHVGGILAMTGTGYLSRKFHLAPDNGQSFGANFFDATVQYAQAMVGFNLANQATFGKLQGGLGGFKMRVENLGKEIPPPRTPSAPAQADPTVSATPAPRATTEPASNQKASWVAELFRKDGGVGKRLQGGLDVARRWWSNLSPAKVKALEVQLKEVEAQRDAAKQTVTEKGTEIAGLEQRLGDLQTRHETAQRDIETKEKNLGDTRQKLQETEGERDTARGEATAKAQALSEAEARLQDLETRKQAAEGQLQAYVEAGERAELGVMEGSLEAQIEALRNQISILRSEKQSAEVQAGTHEQAAKELRSRLTVAEETLERKKRVEAALGESERNVDDLQGKMQSLNQTLGEVRAELASKVEAGQGADRLIADQVRKLGELEAEKTKIGQELEAKARLAVGLRDKLAQAEQSVSSLTSKLGDVEAELRTANFKIEMAERNIATLEQARDGIKDEKEGIDKELGTEKASNVALREQLAGLEIQSQGIERELRKVQQELQTSERLRKSKSDEADRLRANITEAQERRSEREAELLQEIRALDGSVREKDRTIQETAAEAQTLREKLTGEEQRANAAEGREAELQRQHAELQTKHEETEKELRQAQHQATLAARKIEGLERQVEAKKTSNEQLTKHLGALRASKKTVEEELRDSKVEVTRLGRELERVNRLYEAEKDKPADVLEDTARVDELSEQMEALSTAKAELGLKVQDLETRNKKLDGDVARLEGEKAEAQKQLRLTESDLEIAREGAKAVAEDLVALQGRSSTEITELRAGMEEWRRKAEETSAGKATAEAHAQSLNASLEEYKSRAGRLDRDLKEKVRELGTVRGENTVLQGDLERLERDLSTARQELSAKEAELARTQTELAEKIAGLETEKQTKDTTIQEKLALIERLQGELEATRTRAQGVEQAASTARVQHSQEKARLEGEKRKLDRELEAKDREIRRIQEELETIRSRRDELQSEISVAREENAGSLQTLEGEKTELQRKLESAETEARSLREALGSTENKAQGLEEELQGVREELRRERIELGQVRGTLEDLKTRTEAEAIELRSKAEAADRRAQEASAASARETDRAQALDAAITGMRAQAEGDIGAASRVAEAADHRAREEGDKARRAVADLESLKQTSAAEAESLRQEAVAARTESAAAEARAQAAESRLQAEQLRIQEIESRLGVVEAEAESLRVPASRKAEAESNAENLRRENQTLSLQVQGAESRAAAAEERARALDTELAALRASSTGEKERLEGLVRVHKERETAAVARAEAADLRIVALEAEVEQSKAEAVALGIEAGKKNEAEATVASLRANLEQVTAMIREAEGRAAESERQARSLEIDLALATDDASGLRGEVEELQGQKRAAELQAQELQTRLEQLEPQLAEASVKRRTAEAELLGARTRVAELERNLATKETDLKGADGQLERLWQESQRASQEIQQQLEAAQAQVRDLSNEKEGLLEQIGIEQQKRREAEEASAIIAASETALSTEVVSLKGERDKATRYAQRLENAITAKQVELTYVGVSLENEAFSGFRSPHGLFSDADPRTTRVETSVQGTARFGNASGQVNGEAHLCAGTQEGSMRLKFVDGSRVSGRTSRGGRNYQEDGIYMSRFLLPDGTEVKVLAGADGAGGMGGGDVASSAFLQGIHATVVEAARQGAVPTAGELFEQGNLAVETQRMQPDRNNITDEEKARGKKGAKEATGAGAVIVIVGDQATIASAGDAMVALGRKNSAGAFEIIGYTNADVLQGNNLTRGIHQNVPRVYAISGLQVGDQFVMGSDGFYENIVGPVYKEHGSMEGRKIFHKAPPTQEIYRPLLQMFEASSGRPETIAEEMHDLALANIKKAGQKVPFLDGAAEIQLPAAADRDNIFVISYEHGETVPSNLPTPNNYGPLEPVPSFEAAHAAQAAAEPSTARGSMQEATEPFALATDLVTDRALANFYMRYIDALSALYGQNTEAPGTALAKLYQRFPGLEEKFNADLLAAAPTKHAQGEIFKVAEKFIKDQLGKDRTAFESVRADLDIIQKVQKPFTEATGDEVAQLKQRYEAALNRIFGAEVNQAAKFFADTYKNMPAFEKIINPNSLTSLRPDTAENFFKRSVLSQIHYDQSRFNENDIYIAINRGLGGLQELFNNSWEWRRVTGWADPESLKTGHRVWKLQIDKPYVGGQNGDSNIRLTHVSVSKRHFKLYAEVGKWYLEDLGSSYGTHVNGKKLAEGPKGRKALRNGEQIRLGLFDLRFNVNAQGEATLTEIPIKDDHAGVVTQGPRAPMASSPDTDALAFTLYPKASYTLGNKQILDPLVSEAHVEFYHNGATWHVRDLGSTHGTLLDGNDIQGLIEGAAKKRGVGAWRELGNGSLITIGSVVFRFSERADQSASLDQIGAAPKSQARLKTPKAWIFHLPLEAGKSYSLLGSGGYTAAEVVGATGSGEFSLHESGARGEVWVPNAQGRYVALGNGQFSLFEGAIFGIGSKVDTAQYYRIENGVLRAMPADPNAAPAAPNGAPAALSFHFPPGSQPIQLGHENFGKRSSVSSKHVEFAFNSNVWWVRDAGSLNGTLLNQQPIHNSDRTPGEWKQLQPGSILSVGGVELTFSMETDGSMRLEEASPWSKRSARPSPVPPSIPRPARRSAASAPALEGQNLKMGSAREIRLVESKKELGRLHPENPKSPDAGKFLLPIKEAGILGGVLGRSDTELGKIEWLSEGRYKLHNFAIKPFIEIKNDRGKAIRVSPPKGVDYLEPGDRIEFEGHTLFIHP